jgi:hypothetical protein
MYRVENKVSLFSGLFVERIMVTNLREYKGSGVWSPVIWNSEIGYTPNESHKSDKDNTGVWNIKWKENNMSERYGIK